MAAPNMGKRTEEAKQRIIRHIWRSHLREGDQLPSAAQLRRELGVGNVTISRAMQALQTDGVVEIRDKVGVFIRHAEADGYTGWRVGLIGVRLECNAFIAFLVNCLQLALHDSGCEAVSFFRDEWARADQYHFDRLEDFRGLRRSVDSRLLHGVITTAGLSAEAWRAMDDAGLFPCMVGVPNFNALRGVFIDYAYMVRHGIAELRRRGCRRIALCLSAHPTNAEVEALVRAELAPEWSCAAAGQGFHDVRTPEAARALGEVWRQAAPDQLPEALLIPDDLISNWLLPEVAACPYWQPVIINARNRELTLRDCRPVAGWFELSIMELAKMTVQLLMQQLEDQQGQEQLIWYRPAFHQVP